MASFLENFRTFTSTSEVHPSHAFWAGLITLSSIVGRRVTIDMGQFEIRPNLYVVFVAPPGGRKSTAMDYAGAFLEQLEVPMTFDCVTKEALAMTMAASEKAFTPPGGGEVFVSSPLTVLATELSEFIGPSKEGMISFLTTLFDKRGDYKNKTIKRGDEIIVKPNLVLLGCTTPAWITARLRDDVISGGFSRRALFIYETERAARIAFPEVTDLERKAWDEALGYAKTELALAYGPMAWTEDARSFFKHWYEGLVVPKDPYLTGYYESKHVQALKTAMLISLSESCSKVLEKRHLEFALALLEQIEGNLGRVFEGVGRNELNGSAAMLVDFVRQAGGALPEKRAYTIMFAHCNEYEIKQVIEHLVTSEKLVRAAITNSRTNVQIITLFTKQGYEKKRQEIEFNQRLQNESKARLLATNPGTNGGSPANSLPNPS